MSFKYKSIKRPDGNLVKTPSVPVILAGRSNIKIEFMALIDSGADLSVIPRDVADLLNINMDGKKDKSIGIGGEVEVINTNMIVNIKKGHEDYSLNVPVQVILGDNKMPIILGRAVFFDEFSITFDQIHDRISLKKVNKPSY